MTTCIDLSQIGNRTYASQSAIEGLLKELKGRRITVTSRQSIKRAREKNINVDTPFGPVIQELEVEKLNGKMDKIPYAHPWALMHSLLASCPDFKRFFDDRMAQCNPTESSPWRLIIYSDEITPGNVIAHDQRRRTQACYWSLAEYGFPNLCHESLWMPFFLVRSSVVNQLKGGMGALMAAAMMLFFSGAHNGMEGIVLMGSMFFVVIGLVTGDEGALKITIDVRGSSGILPCPCCTNVCMHDSELDIHDATSVIVTIAEFDIRKFRMHSDQSFREAVEHVNRTVPTLTTATDRTLLQKCLGINYSPNGMVARLPFYKPISTLLFDWAHIFLVHGLVQIEIGYMLTKKWIKLEDVHKFVKTFTWPRKLPVTGKNIFAKRSSKATALQSDASETLSVCPVLLVFLQTRLQGKSSMLDMAVRCFTLLCKLLDMLRLATFGFQVNPDDLHKLLVEYLNLHKELYQHVIPKMHMAVHLAMMSARFQGLISCLVHERKHRLVKRHANDMKNTSNRKFEKSVLLGVLNLQKAALQDAASLPLRDPCLLVNRTQVSPSVAAIVRQAVGPASIGCTVWAGSQIIVQKEKIMVQDVVLAKVMDGTGAIVGEVNALLQVGDGPALAIVSQWKALGSSMFDCKDISVKLVELNSNVAPCIYRRQKDVAFVIPPFTMSGDNLPQAQ